MTIYDNGWYRIVGITRSNTHYFFSDKPIHALKYAMGYSADFDKRYASNGRKCKRCINILKAYSKIGLQNRLS